MSYLSHLINGVGRLRVTCQGLEDLCENCKIKIPAAKAGLILRSLRRG